MTNETQLESGHGRKNNQKLKPYLVLQYLLKYTDEDNVASASDIIGFLEDCGIYAERRSIYRDIEDINKIYIEGLDFVYVNTIDEVVKAVLA